MLGHASIILTGEAVTDGLARVPTADLRDHDVQARAARDYRIGRGRGQVVSRDLTEHSAVAARVTATTGTRPGRESRPCPLPHHEHPPYPSCALVVLARRAYVSAVAAHSRPQIRNNGDHKARSHRAVRVDSPVAS